MNTDEQSQISTSPNTTGQDNTSIVPAEISETYELPPTPTMTKEVGVKNPWINSSRSIDLVTRVIETQELYKTLKKTHRTHELLKVNFTFDDDENNEDTLIITYDPRPEDETMYGKNPVIALQQYHAALYHAINRD